ncbi:MAG TPA: molybdenum cofactor biosynthesis protein MoaE [Galbitalea sp.]|jgi:molybdopterin synthase catalytic subunit
MADAPVSDPIGTAVPYARVTTDPLDRAAVERAVLSDSDGALVVFEGIIRDHDGGKAVRGIEYQAHPDAEAFLRSVCVQISAETGLRTAAAHRYGELGIGDVALVAAAAAPHRAEAFAACQRLVDEIKARTPIWKRQHLDDGTSEWVGL